MKTYVAISQFDGSYTGTLDEIFEQLNNEGVVVSDCRFYEVGKEVAVKLSVEE